jgi:predicted acyl esterase
MPPTSDLVLHAAGDGLLAEAPGEPGEPGEAAFSGDPAGFLANDLTGGATFETEPFERDRLFFGVPKLTLAASVTVPRVHLISTLYAVSEDGELRRLSQCALNPELRDGLGKTRPVVPGTVYTLTPPCFAMSYQVRAGQRLRLRVTTSDPDKVPTFAIDPNVSVAFGGENGTRIALPAAQGGKLVPDSIDLGDTEGDEDSGA